MLYETSASAVLLQKALTNINIEFLENTDLNI